MNWFDHFFQISIRIPSLCYAGKLFSWTCKKLSASIYSYFYKIFSLCNSKSKSDEWQWWVKVKVYEFQTGYSAGITQRCDKLTKMCSVFCFPLQICGSSTEDGQASWTRTLQWSHAVFQWHCGLQHHLNSQRAHRGGRPTQRPLFALWCHHSLTRRLQGEGSVINMVILTLCCFWMWFSLLKQWWKWNKIFSGQMRFYRNFNKTLQYLKEKYSSTKNLSDVQEMQHVTKIWARMRLKYKKKVIVQKVYTEKVH